MPNWKTYDSSVRLLSAIIAADPTRKLNYEGKSRLFLSLERFRPPTFSVFTHIHVALICADFNCHFLTRPSDITFPDVAKYYGDGVKYKAIWDRMTLMKRHANSLKDAYDHGMDPHTVELKDSLGATPKSKGGNGQVPVFRSFFSYYLALLFMPTVDVLQILPSDLEAMLLAVLWRTGSAVSRPMQS